MPKSSVRNTATYRRLRRKGRLVHSLFMAVALLLVLTTVPLAFAGNKGQGDGSGNTREYQELDTALVGEEGGALTMTGASYGSVYESIPDGYDLSRLPGTPYDTAFRMGMLTLPDKQVDLPDALDAVHGNGDYSGVGVQIALIDTGVIDVPGLRNSNIVIGPDFSFDDMHDALRGRDTNGHGTHLAGLIVGADAAWTRGDRQRTPERMLGVAPDATLVSVKVGARNGAVDVSQVIAALNWIVESNRTGKTDIGVIVLAYGTDARTDYRSDPLAYAVEQAWHSGIVVVVAAGNDGQATVSNPALDPYVITVGAADRSNRNQFKVAGFSNTGSRSRPVDLYALGDSMVSLRVPGAFSDAHNDSGEVGQQFVMASGSSQAAAVAAGVVALLLEQRPHLTPDQVKAILMESAKVYGRKVDQRFVMAHLAIAYPTPNATQDHPRAVGGGSLDAARGSHRVSIDGIPIQGEVDIFGSAWSDTGWKRSAWSGNSWTGNSWTGNSWTGNSWTGNSWTGNSWTGNSWTGNSWTGNSWTGNSWTGNSWTGDSWS